jgi:hypothetical protein
MLLNKYFSYLLLVSSISLLASDIPVIHLTPPNIGPEYMADDHSCDRPMRRNCFQLSAQVQDDKLLVHNYGAGGAGWALSFGLVREAIAQFEQALKLNPEYQNKSVHIIGAGVMGLLSAILLHEKGYNVKISAKELFDIPSYNAAGMFCPIAMETSADNKEIVDSIGAASFKEWQMVAKGTHSIFKSGAKLLPVFVGKTTDVGLDPYVKRQLMPEPQEVTVDFDNGKVHNVLKYTTVFMDTVGMMEYMHALVEQANISITQKEIASFDEIEESIIFNCAGLGARYLNHDENMMPMQGHLIYLKNQPSIDQMQYMFYTTVTTLDEYGDPIEEFIYYAPKQSGLLGGTFIKGKAATRKNQHQVRRLVQRSEDYFGTN